ncbi:hypothetical protein SAV14893_040230 [Streptomyces avermitilis]|uniref:Uncharacterized protein n=1 Tax=Streptomyces avermitilis TaxID=33903 RepID=A0A4D4LXY2_STRAX|nr:hypothetical protein SAV14893_040230 [Streptomyces avermitilis]GDY84201.1 hypothetical protein SAVCW2_34000 [Streptomyces avermitilis]
MRTAGSVFAVALRGAGSHDTRGIGEELVRMRAFDALSVALGSARAGVQPDANVMPVAYNPGGGKRVQLTWQRYWNSPRYRQGAQPFVHPADPACPARPAACR